MNLEDLLKVLTENQISMLYNALEDIQEESESDDSNFKTQEWINYIDENY